MAGSELAGLGEAVEGRSGSGLRDPHEEVEEVLERSRFLEPAHEDRLLAGVADQLLGDLARLVVGAVETARPGPLIADLVVQDGEVGVERLGDWSVGTGLDLVS